MADFYQHGSITTFHNLVNRPVEDLEAELMRFSKRCRMGLVLPSLFSELETDAMAGIITELQKVPYLDQIIIGLDRADRGQWHYAQAYFKQLPQHYRILWNDGPRLMALHEELAAQQLAPTEMGKGRNVWYCLGYVLASKRGDAIALHDCDIKTYHREMLARLIYPIANLKFDYRFCKGYYARVGGDRLKGRVTRLLVTPLLHALKLSLGSSDYLDYLNSFRYPLSGEFSLRADIIPNLRIPSDWGLEVGILSEIFRNYAPLRICQAEIADIYDHKHQSLSADNPDTGLSKMSIDITKSIYRKLATKGCVLSSETFRTIKATYYRMALDMVASYQNDALMNGLEFDRHAEEQAVETFTESIMQAGDVFLANPMETPFIPSWERIQSAIPDFLRRFYKAVEADHQEIAG